MGTQLTMLMPGQYSSRSCHVIIGMAKLLHIQDMMPLEGQCTTTACVPQASSASGRAVHLVLERVKRVCAVIFLGG